MKGIGMDGEAIPLLCGGVFSTSKNQGNQSTVGKYGVGLKTILLYYHSILSVSSSTRRQSNVTSYRLRMDPGVAESSPLVILKKKVTPKPPELKDSLSGTHITINHVTGDLSRFVPRVKEYVSRLTALTPPFHLLVQIQDESVLDYVCSSPRSHA